MDPVYQKLQDNLPFLPGNNFELNKKFLPNFRKSHAFDKKSDIRIINEKKPGIGGIPLPYVEVDNIKTSISAYPKSKETESIPAWIAFDRKVLRFYAYFIEDVQERRDERFRIRKVIIYFYLEDDSVHIIEPKIMNSGIPQSDFLRRHKVPLPDGPKNQHYTVLDFNVGKVLKIYSRDFVVIGCDEFTRNFLTNLGVQVPENSDYPSDPFSENRKDEIRRMQPKRPYKADLSFRKFLENDRHVLRFYCIWDDRNTMFGDKRTLILHYYLSDDTIEILEHFPQNSGRIESTQFLKRSSLPKKVALQDINMEKCKESPTNEYYRDYDLGIGVTLDVYNRKIVLCDCDEFTRNYYYEKYGIRMLESIEFEKYDNVEDESYEIPPASPLIEKPAQRDFQKFINWEHVILRYLAVLNTGKQLDIDRRFIISYYLEDDTISVYEPQQRNSGIIYTKFLERNPVRKEPNNPENTDTYKTEDFYIGAKLVLWSHPFLIVGADEFAINFMKNHPQMFPKANESNESKQ